MNVVKEKAHLVLAIICIIVWGIVMNVDWSSKMRCSWPCHFECFPMNFNVRIQMILINAIIIRNGNDCVHVNENGIQCRRLKYCSLLSHRIYEFMHIDHRENITKLLSTSFKMILYDFDLFLRFMQTIVLAHSIDVNNIIRTCFEIK